MERTGNHHAALTRNLSLNPLNDAYYSTRHDPRPLPDAHSWQANATVGAVSRERERFNRSRNNDDVSERHEISRPLWSSNDHGDQIRLMGRHESAARDYIDRARGGAKQYPEAKEGEEIRPAPMRRAETMPRQLNASQLKARRERESTRGPRKQPGLITRAGQMNLGGLPNPGTTPEPFLQNMEGTPVTYQRPDSYDYGIDTPDGYRTEIDEPSATAKSRMNATGKRPGLVCQTVSRDETSSEDAKISSWLRMAMEPHERKAQMNKVPDFDASNFLPSRKMDELPLAPRMDDALTEWPLDFNGLPQTSFYSQAG
jgi:hypothetical protein